VNSGNDSITVYSKADTDNITPARTIAGANTGLIYPQGIAVDVANKKIFGDKYWEN
jgi:hypothetical protein